ncbi:hypothetical protein CMT34_17440 [Elizabethkingia anophelis]|nr:hypothetical protein [Elizabethkingia anophelis]
MLLRFLFLISLYPTLALGQPKNTDCVESVNLYQTYQNYTEGDSIDSICLSDKKNKILVFYNKLVLKELGKKNRKFPHGSIWGYKKGSDLFRYFDAGTMFGTYGFHQVVGQNHGLIIYVKKENCGYVGAVSTSTCSYYFYSKDLTTSLKKLTVENLETDYPNPSFLEEVKGLKSLKEKGANSALKINQIYKRYFP